MSSLRRGRTALALALLTSLALATISGIDQRAGADPATHRLIPSAVPATTPNILDGRTHAIAEVGDAVFVAGSFTLAQNPGTSAQLATPYLFKYSRSTGIIDPTFAPALDASVNALAASPDGTALFVGGTFKAAGSTKVRNLVKVSTDTGVLVAGFKNPSPNGAVLDLALVGNRIIAAGSFTTMNAVDHGGLAALDATTGQLDEYVGIDVAVNHNWPSGLAKAPVGVAKVAASPDGSRLVALGNFRQADGLDRDQVMVIRLDADAARVDPDWRTLRYTPACYKDKFDSYVRDVDYSPDGAYFVVVSSGAGYNGTLCDSAARFDSAVTGQAVEPRWVAATGQDSLLSVAVADNAVYVGGHQKWMNAIQSGADQQAGQVPRPGLAALDPVNGVPLSWNPGRHPRGVGAEELLATDNGLYVGSDTDYIGNQEYRRQRLAFLPVSGGSAPSNPADAVLPRNLFHLNGSTLTTRTFTGTSATAATTVTGANTPSSTSMRGAFMVGSRLVHGWTDQKLHYRTFDGSTFGPDVVIDPYNDPLWSSVTSSGTSATYRGRVPTLYTSLSSIAAITYTQGRIYYAKTSDRQIYWRWFSPESLIVGAQEFTLANSSTPVLQYARNLFYADGRLYAGLSSGGLWQMTVTGATATSGWSQVSGAGTSSQWSSGTLFIGPTVNQLPGASISSTCNGQTCTLDGRGSTDADGTVVSHNWDFGDGTSGSGDLVSHGYPGPGTYTATLSVTDEDGDVGSATTTITIEAPPTTIAFRASTGKVTNATSIIASVPAETVAGDGLVAVVSAATTTVPAAPAGWTAVGSPVAGDNLVTVVWQRVAADGDAGRTVTVGLGATAVKATLTVAAYAGTSPTGPVAAMATTVESTTSTQHVSPVVITPGDWVMTVWSDRSSSTTAVDEPAATVVRQRLIGVGGGHVDQLVVDTGGPVAAGGYGALVATTDVASKGTGLTLALH